MKKSLGISPTQSIHLLKTKIATWREIIDNSLDYYVVKYPKINEQVVDKAGYQKIDEAYAGFNKNERDLVSTFTLEQETLYRKENKDFMYLLFTSNNPDEIVNKFNVLLNLDIQGAFGANFTKDIENRKAAFEQLKHTDYIKHTKTDKVLRLKRIFLLRKREFHNSLLSLLNKAGAAKYLDDIKLLYEEEADYAFYSVNDLIAEMNEAAHAVRKSNLATTNLIEEEIAKKEQQFKEEYKVYVDKEKEIIREYDEKLLKEKDEKKIADLLESKRLYLNLNNDEKYTLISNSGNNINKLKQVLEHENKALSKLDVIEKGANNPDTYIAVATYFSEKSASFIVRSMVETPPPDGKKFADALFKDMTQNVAKMALGFFLGPAGSSIGGPFVNEIFKVLWGVEGPDDPYNVRFDHIDKALEKLNERLDLICEKLDKISDKIGDISEEIKRINAKFALTLDQKALEAKMRDAIKMLNNIKSTYKNLYLPDSAAPIKVADLLDFNDRFIDVITSIMQLYWDPSFNLQEEKLKMKMEPQPKTFAYELKKMAQEGDNGTSSRFENIVEMVYPVTSVIQDLCQTFLDEADKIQEAICVVYTMVYFEHKKEKTDDLFNPLQDHFEDKSKYKSKIKAATDILRDYGAIGSQNMAFYDVYQSYRNNLENLDFLKAFCLEFFDPAAPENPDKCKPVYYNYQNNTFEVHPNGQYARFFLLPGEASSERHLFHCVNDDFDQTMAHVKLGFSIGGKPSNQEVFLYGRPELKGKHLRLLTLDKKDFASNDKKTIQGGKDYIGQLDALMRSGKEIDFTKTDRIEIGLPLSFMRLVIDSGELGSRQSLSAWINNSITKDNFSLFSLNGSGTADDDDKKILSFALTDDANHINISIGNTIKTKITFKKRKNVIPEMGISDFALEIDNKPIQIPVDNRYLFTNTQKSEETCLYGGQKLPVAGLVCHTEYQDHYQLQIINEELRLFSSPVNTHWYADITLDTLDKIKGALAVMNFDGNFVFYNKEGKKVWASGTGLHTQKEGFYLKVQEDRNLVIYNKENKPYWASETRNGELSDTAYCRLQIGEKLTYKESGMIDGHKACLSFQDDGNMVLFLFKIKEQKYHERKQSKTNKVSSDLSKDTVGAYAIFEPKGQLVIYNKQGKPLWAEPSEPIKSEGKRTYLQIDISSKSIMLGLDHSYKGCVTIRNSKGEVLHTFWEFED